MFFDEANKLHKEVFGKSMKFVEAIPYRVNGQDLTGGYSAIFCDGQLSTWNAESDFERILSNITLNEDTQLMRQTTHKLVRLKYRKVLQFHLICWASYKAYETSNKDLDFKPARDVYQLLTNPDVKAEVIRVLGKNGYDQFIPWIKAVVKESLPSKA